MLCHCKGLPVAALQYSPASSKVSVNTLWVMMVMLLLKWSTDVAGMAIKQPLSLR